MNTTMSNLIAEAEAATRPLTGRGFAKGGTEVGLVSVAITPIRGRVHNMNSHSVNWKLDGRRISARELEAAFAEVST